MSWLWIFERVWNGSSSSSNFSDFRSEVGIVVLWDLASFKSCWCFFLIWQSCCCSPTVEGPTKSGLLHLPQGCSHCGLVADFWPKFVYFTQSTRNAGFRLAEFLEKLPINPAFNIFKTLLDVLLSETWNGCVPHWLLLRFSCVSLETASIFCLLFSVATLWEVEKAQHLWRLK